MATEITMPKLSDTMEEGTILKWRVKAGEKIAQGDIIAEVETDKAAMEMEAFEDGTVSDLKVAEGETVPVGTVIAVLNGEGDAAAGEEKPPAGEPSEQEAPAPREEQKPAARGAAEEEKTAEKPPAREEQEKATIRSSEGAIPQEQPPPAKEKKGAAREEKPVGLSQQEIVASPAARRLAADRGVDLARVRGTGPGGRIVLTDVEGAMRGKEPVPPPSPEAPRGPAATAPKKPERSVKIRGIVARKMVESWQSTPHFFVTVAVDMTDLIRIRKSLGASINDFLLAAAARCLRDYPWVNSHWIEGETVAQEQINISIAVATERGLYNPVLRDCGRLSLKEISRRATDLVERAHANRLAAEELEGGTFTISNMGMLGVEAFSAIITPPQAAVLAAGTVRGEVVVDEKGEPAIAPQIRLTLSADHRVLDGADAAEFLTGMKSYLEAPVTLITSDYGKE